MILLLALLLTLPILAVFAIPLIASLAVVAVPAIVVLAVIAAPAVAIASVASASSTATISEPVLIALVVLGIAVVVLAIVGVLAYVANRRASRARVEAPRPSEVPVEAREQVIVEPQLQPAYSSIEEALPADLAAQCQNGQLAPCPV